MCLRSEMSRRWPTSYHGLQALVLYSHQGSDDLPWPLKGKKWACRIRGRECVCGVVELL